MIDQLRREGAATAMRKINQAWLEGRVDDLVPSLHPDIIMVFPGFTGRTEGREGLLAGFRDFCLNASVQEFHEHDQQIDVAGDSAVVTFRYEMVYQRSGERYRATGRDLWVFEFREERWLAVWRTMLDVEESAA